MSQRITVQAGQDVDSYCGKCQLELAHIVIAKTPGRAAKVKCKTCGAEHAMRSASKAGAASKTTSTASKARPRSQAARAQQAFEEAMVGRNPADAIRWTLQTLFAEGDLVQHANFGLGVVQGLTVPNKMTVLFQEYGTKVLLHGKT